MPRSGPSGVGNSTSLAVVGSTSVSVSGSSNSPVLPSSTQLLSSSLSSSTSESTTAVNTPNRLLTTSQSPETTSFSASSLSTSSVGPVGSSSISSFMTSTTSTTTTFSTVTNGLDAWHAVVSSVGSSPVTYAKGVSSTFSATITPSSTIPTAYDSPMPFGSTTSTLTTHSEYATLVSSDSSAYSPAPSSTPVPAALDESSTWATPSANHQDHSTGASTSDLAPEPTSTRVPTSTPTSVFNIINEATADTERVKCGHREACFTMLASAGTSAHTVTKPPTAPQQIVSTSPALVTVITQTTQSGSILLTTMTLESVGPGSLVPIPTTSTNVSPNSSPTSHSLLPFILGPVLGVLVIVALCMTILRCRARRRSKNMSNALSSDSGTSRERKDRTMIEETPRVNAVTLGRRITSYRGSSIYTPECITKCISRAGESSQNSNGQFSDPFADSSDMVSSRTSMPPASIRSVDSLSTNMAFTVSVNTDTRDVGEFGSLIDASASSLELRFVAPLVATDDSSRRSPYLSPSWHYDGQSPTSSPKEKEHWNEEGQGETSPVSLRASHPASSKSFSFGTENARLRLHALLEEARRV